MRQNMIYRTYIAFGIKTIKNDRKRFLENNINDKVLVKQMTVELELRLDQAEQRAQILVQEQLSRVGAGVHIEGIKYQALKTEYERVFMQVGIGSTDEFIESFRWWDLTRHFNPRYLAAISASKEFYSNKERSN